MERWDDSIPPDSVGTVLLARISETCCHELDLQFHTSFDIIHKNASVLEYL